LPERFALREGDFARQIAAKAASAEGLVSLQVATDAAARAAEGKAVDGKLGQHEADLSFTSKLLRAVRLLLAVVECASGRRRRIAAQTIRYSMVLLEKFTDEHGLLHRPVVLPIVLHTGRKPLADPMSLESADVPSRIGRDNGGLAFGIVLDDLAAQTEENILARKLPVAVKLAFLFAQGIDRRTPAEVEGALLRWQDLLRELASPPGHVEELEIFQSYVLKTTEMPVEHQKWFHNTPTAAAGPTARWRRRAFSAESRDSAAKSLLALGLRGSASPAGLL
jgi:hypothetical protein